MISYSDLSSCFVTLSIALIIVFFELYVGIINENVTHIFPHPNLLLLINKKQENLLALILLLVKFIRYFHISFYRIYILKIYNHYFIFIITLHIIYIAI